MKKTAKNISLAIGTLMLLVSTSCGHKNEKPAELSVEDTLIVEVKDDSSATPDSVAEAPSEEIAEEQAAETTEPKSETKQTGYTTTPSGLKYKVIRKGTGKRPAATDLVTVNYEGRLTNGTVFDSSYQRGEPATFPLNRVIAGWTEGLQLMQEGAEYELYIPYNLAYGENGGGPIPPKSDLIFKVELIKVQ